MKIKKIMLSLVFVVVAALPSYTLYSMGNGGKLVNPGLFVAMLVASVVSFMIFSFFRLILSAGGRLVVGILVSYVAFLGLYFAIAMIHGNFAEAYMWTPILILTGIPCMAPLIGVSWLGSTRVFESRK